MAVCHLLWFNVTCYEVSSNCWKGFEISISFLYSIVTANQSSADRVGMTIPEFNPSFRANGTATLLFLGLSHGCQVIRQGCLVLSLSMDCGSAGANAGLWCISTSFLRVTKLLTTEVYPKIILAFRTWFLAWFACKAYPHSSSQEISFGQPPYTSLPWENWSSALYAPLEVWKMFDDYEPWTASSVIGKVWQ